MQQVKSSIGIVAIGRNEGERLQRCLASVAGYPMVYVDSGSTDNSVGFAQSVGAHCVVLDMSTPFTAARARNMGFRALLERNPDLEYVMFVDGDCEIRRDWIPKALQVLAREDTVAAVCGRRRERFPEASVFNLLCDIEWDTPVGTARACGGDAVYRVQVLQDVGGFDGGFIAGEEPELCFRIRQAGYSIQRLDAEMTLHDADMTRAAQWWKRTKRSGYAYYLSANKHGHLAPEHYNRKEVKSITIWGGGFFAALILSVMMVSLWPLLLYIFACVAQVFRVALKQKRIIDTFGRNAAFIYALSVVAGKIPQFVGVSQGYLRNLRGQQHTLVEYK